MQYNLVILATLNMFTVALELVVDGLPAKIMTKRDGRNRIIWVGAELF